MTVFDTTHGSASYQEEDGGRVVIKFGYVPSPNNIRTITLDVTPYVVELIRDLASSESARREATELAEWEATR